MSKFKTLILGLALGLLYIAVALFVL